MKGKGKGKAKAKAKSGKGKIVGLPRVGPPPRGNRNLPIVVPKKMKERRLFDLSSTGAKAWGNSGVRSHIMSFIDQRDNLEGERTRAAAIREHNFKARRRRAMDRLARTENVTPLKEAVRLVQRTGYVRPSTGKKYLNLKAVAEEMFPLRRNPNETRDFDYERMPDELTWWKPVPKRYMRELRREGRDDEIKDLQKQYGNLAAF